MASFSSFLARSILLGLGVLLGFGFGPFRSDAQNEKESIEKVRERVDTILKEELGRDWDLYTEHQKGESPPRYDTLRSCPEDDSGLCFMAEWSYLKGMVAVDLYRGHFSGSDASQYLAVLDIGALHSWSNFLIFFHKVRDTLRRVSVKDVPAKGSFEGVSFHRLQDSGEYSVMARYDRGVSTYVTAGVHLYRWVGDEVHTAFDTTTFFYDWKHYGKRFHELGDQEDSIADDEAYRETRKIHFRDTNGDGSKEIVLGSSKMIVKRLDRKEASYREFPVKELLEKERSVLYWDPKRKRYRIEEGE